MVFVTGWLILGGYICVGGLLTHAVVKRMSIGLQLFFNVNLEVYWLVMAVIGTARGGSGSTYLSLDNHYCHNAPCEAISKRFAQDPKI